jgi:hypothetical protein
MSEVGEDSSNNSLAKTKISETNNVKVGTKSSNELNRGSPYSQRSGVGKDSAANVVLRSLPN